MIAGTITRMFATVHDALDEALEKLFEMHKGRQTSDMSEEELDIAMWYVIQKATMCHLYTTVEVLGFVCDHDHDDEEPTPETLH